VKNHKVMYVPGELCFAPENGRHPKNSMRLSFGVQTPEGIAEGMKRLAAAVAEFI
jgi:DNA-binding transcriptional MocR family regulator